MCNESSYTVRQGTGREWCVYCPNTVRHATIHAKSPAEGLVEYQAKVVADLLNVEEGCPVLYGVLHGADPEFTVEFSARRSQYEIWDRQGSLRHRVPFRAGGHPLRASFLCEESAKQEADRFCKMLNGQSG